MSEEQLKAYALKAEELLSSYVHLHDKVLKVAGTFKSLFKRINFEQLYSDSTMLLGQFHFFNNELNAYKSKSFEELSENQKIYLNQLLAFTSKLNITLQILEKRQFLLYNKSRGEKLNWNEYSSVEQQYKDSIEEYMVEGKRLNELNHLVFSSSSLQETSVAEGYFSLNDTFVFLADSVSVLSVDEFVAQCRNIGMVEQPFDDADPIFDNGYLFRYITDDDATAMLELLEKEGRILQAGVQIIYTKTLSSSNLDEHYKNIVKIARSYYGIGQPTQVGNTEILNCYNSETLFYVSKLNVDNKGLLTFRVGNRQVWDNLDPKTFFKMAEDLSREYSKNQNVEISLELTEEEQREIKNTFKLFKDYAVHPEYADEVEKAIMSFSLSMYSLSVARLGIQSKETNLQKAVSSIEKAYSIYQLPLYLYDLACFLEQKGRFEEAKEMYKKFLNTQMNYNIRPIDKVILAQRDLEESIKVARSKVL